MQDTCEKYKNERGQNVLSKLTQSKKSHKFVHFVDVQKKKRV